MEVFAIQNSEKSCLKALAFRHKATPCFKGNLKLIRIACMHVLVISIKYSEKKKKAFYHVQLKTYFKICEFWSNSSIFYLGKADYGTIMRACDVSLCKQQPHSCFTAS